MKKQYGSRGKCREIINPGYIGKRLPRTLINKDRYIVTRICKKCMFFFNKIIFRKQ